MNYEDNDIQVFAEKMNYDIGWVKKLTFINILISSNMMQTLFSKTQEDLTSKQWLMLILLLITKSKSSNPPTLSDLGKTMGCSRQNIKQIADVLKKKGYITFSKSASDKNAIRLVPTQKWFSYLEESEKITLNILEKIFDGFTDEELLSYFNGFLKLTNNLNKINEELQK